MIRYILLIPFALLIAIGASSLFLLIASIADPVMAVLTGDTLLVGFRAFVDEVFSSDDPGPIVVGGLRCCRAACVFTLLVFPPLLVAILSEVIRARSAIWYGAATGVLTAAIPWILRGSARVGSPGELHVELRSRPHRRGRGARSTGRLQAGIRAASPLRYRADVARILMAKAENRPANV